MSAYYAEFEHSLRESRISRTGWRRELNSNCRATSRTVSNHAKASRSSKGTRCQKSPEDLVCQLTTVKLLEMGSEITKIPRVSPRGARWARGWATNLRVRNSTGGQRTREHRQPGNDDDFGGSGGADGDL